MFKINPKIYLYASPVCFIDPERSMYHNSFLNKNQKKIKLIYALFFWGKSILIGFKKLLNRKIEGIEFINKPNSKFVIYCPDSFLNKNDYKCFYFPSAPLNTSYFIVNKNKSLPNNILSLSIKLFKEIKPYFVKTIDKTNKYEKLILWLIFLSYFFSFEVVNHYYIACGVSDLCKNRPKIKHICLHEMHPYSRIVYGVTSLNDSTSITLQHAFIHFSRLQFQLKDNLLAPYLPNYFYVWSDESRKTLINFGWPGSLIKICSTERYLFLRSLKKEIKNKKLLNKAIISDRVNKDFNIIFIPSLLNTDVNLSIKASKIIRESYPKLKIYIKLHPNTKVNIFNK